MERLYRKNGRKSFVGIFPKDFSGISKNCHFSRGQLKNLPNNCDDELLRNSFKSQGYRTKFSQKNAIKKASVIKFIEQTSKEFEAEGDISTIIIYISTHGFTSQYGQHLYFYDGNILLDDLLTPLYDCPGLQNVPFLVIIHSCYSFIEIPSYQLQQVHNLNGRMEHSKVDVGFIFSADELDPVNGTSHFAEAIKNNFEKSDDIFRATSTLGLQHSFRERPEVLTSSPISCTDQYYTESKRKKAAIIITLGEFDQANTLINADYEREEMKKLVKKTGYDVIASKKTYITLESCKKFIKNIVKDSFQEGHEFDSILIYLKTHGSWGKSGQILSFSNDTEIALLDLLQPFTQGALNEIPKAIFVEACQGATNEHECLRFSSTPGLYNSIAANTDISSERSEPRHLMLNTIFFKAATERTMAVTPGNDFDLLSPFTEALREIVNEAIRNHKDINAWDLSCELTKKMSSKRPVNLSIQQGYDKFLLCQTDTMLTKNLKIYNNIQFF